MIKTLLERLKASLNNQHKRDEFVIEKLKSLRPGALLLDAGCGSQRYRQYCDHLIYRAQDFGAYVRDEKKMLGSKGVGGDAGYVYGDLSYVGDIWDIAEKDSTFDAVLCTEVFEHIPYPIQAVKEFARLLKPGGTLILTAPGNCLRHMDPYFFYSGFSDRFYEKILPECGFSIGSIEPVGDYYSWMAVELARTAYTHGWISKVLLAPAFLFFYLRKRTRLSVDTLCEGYHVVATK